MRCRARRGSRHCFYEIAFIYYKTNMEFTSIDSHGFAKVRAPCYCEHVPLHCPVRYAQGLRVQGQCKLREAITVPKRGRDCFVANFAPRNDTIRFGLCQGTMQQPCTFELCSGYVNSTGSPVRRIHANKIKFANARTMNPASPNTPFVRSLPP